MRTALSLLLAFSVAAPATAAGVSRTYSYFAIGGVTLTEIERQLHERGPRLQSTGRRHPGATNMEFTTRIDYAEAGGHCRVANARVGVKAEVFLPRWRDRRRAGQQVRLIWDTLSRDIKRHEESHLSIAKNHARRLEDALKSLGRGRSCTELAHGAEAARARILAEHDAAQDRFDRIEAINFERRILRLLNYRLEQIEAGRLRP